jgi:hypothetical protein
MEPLAAPLLLCSSIEMLLLLAHFPNWCCLAQQNLETAPSKLKELRAEIPSHKKFEISLFLRNFLDEHFRMAEEDCVHMGLKLASQAKSFTANGELLAPKLTHNPGFAERLSSVLGKRFCCTWSPCTRMRGTAHGTCTVGVVAIEARTWCQFV